jgi:hypothetical protein
MNLTIKIGCVGVNCINLFWGNRNSLFNVPIIVSGSLLSDCPEDGGSKLLLNVGASLRIYATLYVISLQSSASPLRKPRVSNIHV